MPVGTIYSDYSNIASASTPIEPDDVAHLEVWLDSAQSFAAASHNDAVVSWADLSGNARHALQSSATLKPLVQKTSNTSPSGQPLVRFDGVDDTLASGSYTFPTISRGYSFYFYGRLRQVTAPPGPFGFGVIFTDAATDAAPQIGYEANPNGPPFVRTTTTQNLHSGNIYGAWQLYAVVFKTNGTVQGYRATLGNAVTALSANPGYSINPALATGGYQISGNLSGNGCINADLASMIWYSDEHDITRIGQIRNYLLGVYGEE